MLKPLGGSVRYTLRQTLRAKGARASLALALLPASPALASVTGICPDGSMFIVQHPSQIPCRAAKEVDPIEVPPIRPQYMPNPYTWQVYNEQQDPNNPYNLIDSVRDIRALQRGGASSGEPAPEDLSGDASGPGWDDGDAAQGAAPQPTQLAARVPVGPLDLGLADQELRDLYQIVELSQETTPAAFERRTADGRGVIRLSLARSLAFEERLEAAWASRGGLGSGGVLLFTAVSKQPETFHPNLTFVQDHLTFQPDAENPAQLGILQGRLGALDADEVVLGYVILPESLELTAPFDIYWDDRRMAVQFPE
jgi:hypothetical protein